MPFNTTLLGSIHFGHLSAISAQGPFGLCTKWHSAMFMDSLEIAGLVEGNYWPGRYLTVWTLTTSGVEAYAAMCDL